jgi:hypothetical protein
MTRTASGHMSRASLWPPCLPPRENGWHGGPPLTKSISPECRAKLIPRTSLSVRPLHDSVDPSRLILPDGVTTPSIPFDYFNWVKSSRANTKAKPARSREELYRTHSSPVKNRRSMFSNCSLSRSSHSQTTKNRQPKHSKPAWFRLSRIRFASSFGRQNSRRLFGSRASGQL